MKRPGKLLIISEVGCGPPHLGNRIRVQSLIKELHALGFEIHFAGVNMSAEEKAGTLPFVQRWAWDFQLPNEASLKNRMHHKWAMMRGKGRHLRLAGEDAVDRWMKLRWLDEAKALQRRENYDVVLVEYVFHSAFLECFPGCLKVLDTHDVFSNRNQLLSSAGVSAHWFTTNQPDEAHAIKRADSVLAIQSKEAEFFRSLAEDQAAVFTVGHISGTQSLPLPKHGKPIMGYLASDNTLNVLALEWFLAEVWPAIRERSPQAELHVAGGICKKFREFAGGRLLGSVDSISDFYKSVSFTINPMRAGTGLKIKTIESMAHSRPTIGTSVACEGLESCVGRGLTMTDQSADFAEVCNAYFDAPDGLLEASAMAVSAVEEINASWRKNLREAFLGKSVSAN